MASLPYCTESGHNETGLESVNMKPLLKIKPDFIPDFGGVRVGESYLSMRMEQQMFLLRFQLNESD